MNIEGMTDELKRIRIAEACGWKRAPEFDYVLASPIYRAGERMEMMCKDGDIRAIEELPDYLNDLNAMHEAEKTMQFGQLDRFDRHLMEHTGAWQTAAIHATARQRSDAFLLTLPEPKEAK